MKVLNATLYGPYAWFGEDSIFNQSAGSQAGVYLWSIPWKGQYLTYYIGQTGRRFIDRLQEHAQEYLKGEYQIYDQKAFRQGEKNVVWNGLWRLRKQGIQDQLNDFLIRFHEIRPREFLKLFSIFIIPIEDNRRIRERLEAGIGETLEAYSVNLKEFLNELNQKSFRPRWQDEEACQITIVNHEKIIGLPKTMMI